MKKTKKQMEQQFKQWVASIPIKISILIDLLPNDLGFTFDFSLESMNKIESYLIDTYSYSEFVKQHELFDCVASYAGKVYENNVADCEWRIYTDDERSIFFNIPLIEATYKVNFSPHMNVRAALDRKRGTYISDVIGKHNNFIKRTQEASEQDS